jgi:hypothetical protein
MAIVPYIELPLERDAIVSVRVGPGNNVDVREAGVRRLLKTWGAKRALRGQRFHCGARTRSGYDKWIRESVRSLVNCADSVTLHLWGVREKDSHGRLRWHANTGTASLRLQPAGDHGLLAWWAAARQPFPGMIPGPDGAEPRQVRLNDAREVAERWGRPTGPTPLIELSAAAGLLDGLVDRDLGARLEAFGLGPPGSRLTRFNVSPRDHVVGGPVGVPCSVSGFRASPEAR